MSPPRKLFGAPLVTCQSFRGPQTLTAHFLGGSRGRKQLYLGKDTESTSQEARTPKALAIQKQHQNKQLRTAPFFGPLRPRRPSLWGVDSTRTALHTTHYPDIC